MSEATGGWSRTEQERRAIMAVFVARGSLAEVAAVQTFVLVFASIAIEALPFILLGTAVSAAIAV